MRKYNYLFSGVLAFIEVLLLTALLKKDLSWSWSPISIPITGFIVTLIWAAQLYFVVRAKAPQAVGNLAVDFTQRPSVFVSVICCIGFLFLWLLFAIIVFTSRPQQYQTSQQVNDYFEKIRDDHVILTAFLTAMPKGGDLHHHYSGSIYGETYWNMLTDSDGWMNPYSLEVDTVGARHKPPWKHFNALRSEMWFDSLKQAFLRKVSVKNYDELIGPTDQHFFSTFARLTAVESYDMQKCLQELKKRAVAENVHYIETMLGSPDTAIQLSTGPAWEQSMTGALLSDSTSVLDTLNKVYAALITAGVTNTATKFCHKLDLLHQKATIDDSAFMMRYQLHANRSAPPLSVYRKLLIAFHSASLDSLVVGVNLVSPEDGEVSMRDYSLHMLMFAHLHRHYPNIKYALHAGELASGMVQPELLRYHIRQAIFVAGAQRIGHGVDIAHEAHCVELLNTMSKRKIPVEINLSSNEFILHVKNEKHPIMLYHSHKVPIIISTDDAGVLRTDLTQQYILLATRYPSLPYIEIKKIVRNSIAFSFLQPNLKRQKLQQLDKALSEFENDVLRNNQASESSIK
ncbi:adenosine deaminase [Chitinophaga ginsengisoli]|uniref:adenosine deaminase n=2 Tax=Chitinophaga ginsengisoli TaxID=363837 RepID=A0A2P8G274_9BACT|nr:adenosine deaminase [Chitinophaga ginsengisoli]